MSTGPPIIGTRKYCNNCKTERIELIDKNGITDAGFKTWKWAQTCENCERNDFLEYLPIRLGDSLLGTVNEALAEYAPKKKNSNPTPDNQTKPYSVLDAKRVHEGPVIVIGTIVSVYDMYVVDKDGTELGYRDARRIQLEDTEKPEQNERLDVILYDDMVLNVRAGEVVEIAATKKVEVNKKNKKKFSVLHSESIKYLNRKELVITDNDIEAFVRFASYQDPIDRLVSMFAPNIIEHQDAKLGILRSIVGGIEHDKIRGRINTFLVGDPGTAKSTLVREAVDLKANSRYVSGPHSSAKTITAIMDKENDGLILRLGAIPLSKGAICGINEITEFPPEDQARLLDVLEEGIIPLNKYGTHMILPAATTIIATANPMQSTWNNSQTVSNKEIPLLQTLIDRFDQIFYFRDNMNVEQTAEFVRKMGIIRKRETHNYNFLRKYLIYASTLEVQITPEAEFMLNEFWIRAKVQGTLSIRGLNSLFRIAEAQAKLQLKNVVDEEIANQTMESIRLIMVQHGETVQLVRNPWDITINAFLEILEGTNSAIEVRELCKIACKRDVQVSSYLGTNWIIRHNYRLKDVIRLLLDKRENGVRRIGLNPMTLQFLGDACDACDAEVTENNNENTN